MHEAERAEGVYELLHMLAEDRFLTVGYWAYLPVRAKTMLDQLLPVFRIYEPGAAFACVPHDASVIGRVLTQIVGITTEVAAGRYTLHVLTPFLKFGDLMFPECPPGTSPMILA